MDVDAEETQDAELDTPAMTVVRGDIDGFVQRVSGGDATKYALEQRSRFRDRAAFVLEWFLQQADVAEEDEYFDEKDFVNLMLQRLRRVQDLREQYIEFFIRKSVHPEGLRARPQAGNFKKHQVPYMKLGHAQVILQYSEKLVRSAYVLTRLLENEADGALKDHLMDPFSTFQQKRFERIWNRAYDEEEGAECPRGSEERKVVQILVEHCIDQALVHKFRRYDNFVFEEVKATFNGNVYGTRAFKLVAWPDGDPNKDKGTMDEFFTRACNKDVFPKMWELSLDPGIKAKVVENMVTGIEQEFPRLIRQRNLLSFRNGILDTTGGAYGTFYFYEELAKSGLDPKMASAKFFDLEINPEWLSKLRSGEDWFHAIPTPKFQSILDYQNLGMKDAKEVEPACGEMEVDLEDDDNIVCLEQLRVRMYRHIQAFIESCGDSILNSRFASHEDDERSAMNALPRFCDTLIEKASELKAQIAHDVQVGEGLRPAPRAETTEVETQQPLEERKKEHVDEKAGKGRYDLPGSALPQEVQRWIYIFLGRLLHALNVHDQWQIMPFLKGRAGTGKSAIGDIIQRFFEPEQIGILSSNIEGTFGLSAIADKFIMLCLEVKKEFRLNQAEFQSLVSGEMVSMAVKNKQPYQKKWTAPGLLCGNEWAGYQDTQGSIARRLAVINFKFPIASKDSNPNLVKEIVADELAALIVKCNIAYRQQALAKDGKDIWKILPEYFRYQRRLLQVDTDPIWATLFDPSIFSIEPGAETWMEDFMQEYTTKWKQLRGNHFPAPLTEDTMASALHEASIRTGLKFCDDAHAQIKKKVIFGLRYLKKEDSVPAQQDAAAPSR